MKALFVLLLCFSAFAQQFDVAAVKQIEPAAAKTIASAKVTINPGSVYLHGTTLGYAIEQAFDIQIFQISGPDWMFWRAANDQPRYEIIAKTDPATPKAQMKIMLQHLLVDRFGIRYHYEDQQKPAYVFVPDSHGLKLTFIEEADGESKMSYDPATGKMEFRNMTMKDLCGDIGLTVKEPVIDGTAIGSKLFNASGLLLYEKGTGEMVPALFSAMKKYLGLDIERKRAPIKTLVVDSVLMQPIQEQ